MSNGWHMIANVETDDGHVSVREVWGSYAPDYQRTIEVTDGSTSLFITPEQMRDLINQVKLTAADFAALGPPLPGQWTGGLKRYPP